MGAKQYPRTPTPQTRAQKNRTTSSTSSLPSRDTGRPNPYTIMYANTRRQTRKRVAQRPTQRDNESPMGRWSEHSREPALPAQQRQKGKLGVELLTYTKWNQTHFFWAHAQAEACANQSGDRQQDPDDEREGAAPGDSVPRRA